MKNTASRLTKWGDPLRPELAHCLKVQSTGTIAYELGQSGQKLKLPGRDLGWLTLDKRPPPHPAGYAILAKGLAKSCWRWQETPGETAKEREREREFFLHIWDHCWFTRRMKQRMQSAGRSQHNSFPRLFRSHFFSPASWKQIAFLPVREVRGSLHVLWGKNSGRRINLEGTEVGKIGLNYSTTSEIKIS